MDSEKIFMIILSASMILAGAYLLIRFLLNVDRARKTKPPEPQQYPFRPDVEERLPNGKLTTHGYAAANPGEFQHWEGGWNCLGEVIDETDWEDWYVNYYGVDI